MKLTVRYFASLREALGAAETLELEDVATVFQLRDHLIARSPAHAAALARGRAVRCALNQTMCDESSALTAGAEVAFFPPVTGG
jgi:molybdopterin synthase sulfur carrier subunit